MNKKIMIKKVIQRKKELKKFKNKNVCQECGTNQNLTIHHIKPKQLGGTCKRSNLLVLCRSCHNKVHRIRKKLLRRGDAVDKTDN